MYMHFQGKGYGGPGAQSPQILIRPQNCWKLIWWWRDSDILSYPLLISTNDAGKAPPPQKKSVLHRPLGILLSLLACTTCFGLYMQVRYWPIGPDTVAAGCVLSGPVVVRLLGITRLLTINALSILSKRSWTAPGLMLKLHYFNLSWSYSITACCGTTNPQ